MKKPTGRGSVVADKRNFDQAPQKKQKQPAAPRGKPPRQPRRGNFLTRGITGLVSLTWRVVWGSFWRLGQTVTAIVLAATFYFYTTLPEASALFDGRARGSVTMQDTEGRVFAWRGETFGMVSADKIAPVLKNAVVATED